jgi:hypothetical protein
VSHHHWHKGPISRRSTTILDSSQHSSQILAISTVWLKLISTESVASALTTRVQATKAPKIRDPRFVHGLSKRASMDFILTR